MSNSSREIWLPSANETKEHLERILDRGSVLLGQNVSIERLLLMLTRSCELRCSYCFVNKTETGKVMTQAIAEKSIDLLMSSTAARLEVQFFGGEPTREWDLLYHILCYADKHPMRNQRKMEYVITTNGISLSPEKIRLLSSFPVVILFSLDGDRETHRSFRKAYLLSEEDAYRNCLQTMLALQKTSLNWFMNSTIPPKAANQVFERYLWARKYGTSRLQLNYSVGHYWKPEQMNAYLSSLQQVLHHHAQHPKGLLLFNWKSECEPVMLSNEIIVDVDGSILHDGAIFLERSLPKIRNTYMLSHIDTVQEFDPLRLRLRELYDRLYQAHQDDSRSQEIIEQNCLMGAAVDLIVQRIQQQYPLEHSPL